MFLNYLKKNRNDDMKKNDIKMRKNRLSNLI